jgi:hypothetical protein
LHKIPVTNIGDSALTPGGFGVTGMIGYALAALLLRAIRSIEVRTLLSRRR